MKYMRILLLVVLTGLASTAFAQNASTKPESATTRCSNASLSGTYGWIHGGTASNDTPVIGVSQITFDPTTGTYSGEDTLSRDGVVITESIYATYTITSDCTGTGTVEVDGVPAGTIAFVVTSTGFVSLNLTPGGVRTLEGPGMKQGSPTCTNAGVEGSFGFQATGDFVAGAPVTGPVAFIGELKLSVDSSGDGVIIGHLAGSEDGAIFRFVGEPVTGTYSVAADCTGTATITPKGKPALNFTFVVVDGGSQILVLETDADTVVSGTLQQ